MLNASRGLLGRGLLLVQPLLVPEPLFHERIVVQPVLGILFGFEPGDGFHLSGRIDGDDVPFVPDLTRLVVESDVWQLFGHADAQLIPTRRSQDVNISDRPVMSAISVARPVSVAIAVA
jgi:hypothetical protein